MEEQEVIEQDRKSCSNPSLTDKNQGQKSQKEQSQGQSKEVSISQVRAQKEILPGLTMLLAHKSRQTIQIGPALDTV